MKSPLTIAGEVLETVDHVTVRAFLHVPSIRRVVRDLVILAIQRWSNQEVERRRAAEQELADMKADRDFYFASWRRLAKREESRLYDNKLFAIASVVGRPEHYSFIYLITLFQTREEAQAEIDAGIKGWPGTPIIMEFTCSQADAIKIKIQKRAEECMLGRTEMEFTD